MFTFLSHLQIEDLSQQAQVQVMQIKSYKKQVLYFGLHSAISALFIFLQPNLLQTSGNLASVSQTYNRLSSFRLRDKEILDLTAIFIHVFFNTQSE